MRLVKLVNVAKVCVKVVCVATQNKKESPIPMGR